MSFDLKNKIMTENDNMAGIHTESCTIRASRKTRSSAVSPPSSSPTHIDRGIHHQAFTSKLSLESSSAKFVPRDHAISTDLGEVGCDNSPVGKFSSSQSPQCLSSRLIVVKSDVDLSHPGRLSASSRRSGNLHVNDRTILLTFHLDILADFCF